MTSTVQETCPRWCERDHATDDPPESRFHEQVLADFPAVVGHRPDLADPPVGLAEDVVVRRVRYFHAPQTWLVIEEAEDAARHLVLSLDAAAPLMSALQLVTRDGG
ncbi:hypothetical protein EHW97_01350 [Aeromicrobium camelliae]|uniref:Uncharacterized protein n=1 Tax=Aeromicrobium camelliae TaxID=1538144 RepID=A0A3N6WYQ0_9ACTN|nr:hypothetical protein [Aeromicrobium camelliae]RQN10162.1 hypothetical protein EHW97_01350 [Aeromicrobium camelliae]